MSSQPRPLRPWRSPMMPLRTMSGSLAMQQQKTMMTSLVHIITRDHVPGLGSCYGFRTCPRLSRTGPTPHWQWCSGELSYFSPVAALGRVGPVAGSTVKLALRTGAQVASPESMNKGKLVQSSIGWH